MANRNRTASAVLPLPPLEWDPQWGNSLIRTINFWIQQTENPGDIGGTSLVVRDNKGNIAFSIETAQSVPYNYVTMIDLPTSATGLGKNVVWRDPITNILHITPP